MTVTQKKEALQNALTSFGFDKDYFVEIADKRMGHKFAIATLNSHSGSNIHSNFMTYDEFNAYLLGYSAAKFNKHPQKL